MLDATSQKGCGRPEGRGPAALANPAEGREGETGEASRSSGTARTTFKPSTAAILIVPYFWRRDNAVKSQQFIWCRRTAVVPRKRLAGRPRSVAGLARRSRTRKRDSRLSVKCIAAGPGGRPAAFCEPRLREGDKPGRKSCGSARHALRPGCHPLQDGY